MRQTLSLAVSTLFKCLSTSRLCWSSRSARSPLRRVSNLTLSACKPLEWKISFFHCVKQECFTPRLLPSKNLFKECCTASERFSSSLLLCQNSSQARMTRSSKPLREPFSHFAMTTSKSFLAFLWTCSMRAKPSWILFSACVRTSSRTWVCRLPASSSAASRFLPSTSSNIQCFQAKREACSKPFSLPSAHCRHAACIRAAVLRFCCSSCACLHQKRRDSRTRATASP
mmetsp:Transcript_37048/g.103049  ORF Transcript_37048/g.103049 Transcript_37048/m.103049 type:complete len:228 (-) Transcript_37048:1514-2197(-)